MAEYIVKAALASLASSTPAIIGVSACQGAGKTYATTLAAKTLAAQGISALALSIDDFYLPHAQQVELASQGNPLLKYRGLPGTHDVQLIKSVLDSLKKGLPTTVPQYDKSAFGGQGDRVGSIQVEGPLKVILFEGWFLGFESIGLRGIEKALNAPEGYDCVKKYNADSLMQIDALLKTYEPIWTQLDSLIYMRPKELSYVYTWRLEQEHALIRVRGTGMSDDQVVDFVNQYMPCYELYADSVGPNYLELALDRSITVHS